MMCMPCNYLSLCKILLASPLLCMSLCDHACLSHSDLEHLQGQWATIVHCKMKCKLLTAVDQEIRVAAVTELNTLAPVHMRSLCSRDCN